MTISEDCFAPFDLSKTRKFDRKKDQESLRKSFYKLGVQYFEVSCFTIKNLNWMPVTLANVAFSCELLLKAILYGFGVDFSKTHGLKGLFEKLPQNEQEYISKNIKKLPIALSLLLSGQTEITAPFPILWILPRRFLQSTHC